jgi:hypothetical protein
MIDTEIPEYEYLDETPTEGDPLVFLWCLANEADYLAGEEPMPRSFAVSIEMTPVSTIRRLVDLDEEGS